MLVYLRADIGTSGVKAVLVNEADAIVATASRAFRGTGFAGQVHGATLLGADDQPLRPAILCNDGRSHAECAELERRCPLPDAIVGDLAMAGFTTPKLMWGASRFTRPVTHGCGRACHPWRPALACRSCGPCVASGLDLQPRSGRREYLESLVNRYV